MTRLIDADDRILIQRTTEAARELIQVWYRRQQEMSVGYRAGGALFVHATNCWISICKLLDNCPNIHEIEVFSNGAAAVLRSLHDTCLQLEYLLAGDSTKTLTTDMLGQRYLDFEAVEKYRRASRVDSYKSKLAKHIASSPKRAAGESALRSEYERVEANYPNKMHWYPYSNLSNLSTQIGREERVLLASQPIQ